MFNSNAYPLDLFESQVEQQWMFIDELFMT